MENIIYDSVYLAFRKKYKEFKECLNKNLSEFDLSSQHVSYLLALDKCKQMKIKDINEYTQNDGAITSRVVKKLLSIDAISQSEDNTRKCFFELTKKGKELVCKIIIILNQARKECFKGITDKEFELISKIAKKLI